MVGKSGIIYFLGVLFLAENINGTPNQNLHHQQQQQHYPQGHQGQQQGQHQQVQGGHNGNHHNMNNMAQHHGGNGQPPPQHHPQVQQQQHHPQQQHPQKPHHQAGNQFNKHGGGGGKQHPQQQQDAPQFQSFSQFQQPGEQEQQTGNGMFNNPQQDMTGGQFHGPNPSMYPEFLHPNSLGSFDSPQFPNFPDAYFSPVSNLIFPPNEHLHQIFTTLFSHCHQSPHDHTSRICLIDSLRAAKDQLTFAHEGLSAHNQYRALHGVPPLKLDHKLSRDSLAYAKHLASSDAPVVHSDTTDRGENIYSARGYKMTGKMPVDGWYSEIALYNFSNPELDFGKNAHFTQLVWKDTERVGMAWAKRKNGEVMVVAQYQPPGNDGDVLRENVLEPRAQRKWEEEDEE